MSRMKQQHLQFSTKLFRRNNQHFMITALLKYDNFSLT